MGEPEASRERAATPAGLGPRDPADQIRPAGQTGPGDQAGQDGPAGPGDQAPQEDPAGPTVRDGRSGAAEPAVPVRPEQPVGLWRGGRRALTAGLVSTITLVAFESLAVITILPVVSDDLNGLGLYGWVTSAFFLGTVAGIVLAGDDADRSGPARPFTIGLTLFAGGLTVAACAPTMITLVAARVLQGLGGGAITAVAYATIGRAYPEPLHPRMFAVLSTAWVAPGLGGPAIAAVVAEHVGWRWVFGGLIPLVLVTSMMIIGTLRSLGRPPRAETAADPAATGRSGPDDAHPDDAHPDDAHPDEKRVPLTAAIRVSAGTGLLLAGFTSRSVWGVPMVVAGVLVGFSPLRRLLPAGTLRARPGMPAAVAARGPLTFAFFGAATFVPLCVTAVRGEPTSVAGLTVSTSTVCWTVASWTQERLAGRRTRRGLVTAGFTALVTGIAGTATLLVPAVPLAVGVAGWGLAGFGIGLAYSPIAALVLAASPPDRKGAASVAIQLTDNLGIALGAGVSGVAVAASKSATGAVTTGIAVTFAMAAAAGLLGVSLARRLPAQTVPRLDRAPSPDHPHTDHPHAEAPQPDRPHPGDDPAPTRIHT
jgi:MFS family permease